MPNPDQPTISLGATGVVVRRLQRALRRTPNPGVTISGIFDAQTETAVKEFQQGAGLADDGVVGPLTWNSLPGGGPMPTLKEGSTGDVVGSLQTVLTNGADGQWMAKHASFGGSLSKLGRCQSRRDCRGPDMVSFVARSRLYLGVRGRSQLCHWLARKNHSLHVHRDGDDN